MRVKESEIVSPPVRKAPNDIVSQLRSITPGFDVAFDEKLGEWQCRGLPKLLVEQSHGTRAFLVPEFRSGSRQALLDRVWEVYGESASVAIAVAPQSPADQQRYVRWNGTTFADLPVKKTTTQPGPDSDTFFRLPSRPQLAFQQRQATYVERTRPVSPHHPHAVHRDFDAGQTLVGQATHELEADSSRDVPSLAVSAFAGARWDPERGNARYRGSQEDLLALVQDHWHDREPGANRSSLDAVVVVPVPVENFVCDSVLLSEATPLYATYSRRADGEDGYARVSAQGEPEAAAFAGVVLYSKSALCENDGKRSSGADWEVVSIVTSPEPRSRPGELPPMNPLTIARNILEKPGGTAMPLSGELAVDFAKAILYHARRASLHRDDNEGPTPLFAASASNGGQNDLSVPPRGNAPALLLSAASDLYRGGGEELLGLVQKHWPSPAPRGDAVSLSLPPDGFVCASAPIDETSVLGARFHPEHGFETLVQAEPPIARSVQAELRRQQNGWSLVKLETSRFEQPEPEHPIALARRLLKRDQTTSSDAIALANSVYRHSLAATVA